MNCFDNNNEKDLQRIINSQALEYSIIYEKYLMYKQFHDEILNNEAIKRKFKEYEEIINNLQNEIYKLKKSSN